MPASREFLHEFMNPGEKLTVTSEFLMKIVINVGKYYDLAESAPNNVERTHLLNLAQQYATLYATLK